MASYKEALRNYIYALKKTADLEQKLYIIKKPDERTSTDDFVYGQNGGKTSAYDEILMMMEQLK